METMARKMLEDNPDLKKEFEGKPAILLEVDDSTGTLKIVGDAAGTHDLKDYIQEKLGFKKPFDINKMPPKHKMGEMKKAETFRCKIKFGIGEDLIAIFK